MFSRKRTPNWRTNHFSPTALRQTPQLIAIYTQKDVAASTGHQDCPVRCRGSRCSGRRISRQFPPFRPTRLYAGRDRPPVCSCGESHQDHMQRHMRSLYKPCSAMSSMTVAILFITMAAQAPRQHPREPPTPATLPCGWHRFPSASTPRPGQSRSATVRGPIRSTTSCKRMAQCATPGLESA
jgi:hypothetical protein